MLLHRIKRQELVLDIDAVRSQSFGKTSLSTHLGVDRCAPLCMKQTYVNVSFFRCFTLSPNVSSVHQQIQQKTTNQTEAKANRNFWTPSAVFARVCYGCGPTTLGCSGFKDVGLRLGCVCFSKSVQACNWNKLHTPHSKHGSIGKCFEGQVIKYHPNDMQFLCG